MSRKILRIVAHHHQDDGRVYIVGEYCRYEREQLRVFKNRVRAELQLNGWTHVQSSASHTVNGQGQVTFIVVPGGGQRSGPQIEPKPSPAHSVDHKVKVWESLYIFFREAAVAAIKSFFQLHAVPLQSSADPSVKAYIGTFVHPTEDDTSLVFVVNYNESENQFSCRIQVYGLNKVKADQLVELDAIDLPLPSGTSNLVIEECEQLHHDIKIMLHQWMKGLKLASWLRQATFDESDRSRKIVLEEHLKFIEEHLLANLSESDFLHLLRADRSGFNMPFELGLQSIPLDQCQKQMALINLMNWLNSSPLPSSIDFHKGIAPASTCHDKLDIEDHHQFLSMPLIPVGLLLNILLKIYKRM